MTPFTLDPLIGEDGIGLFISLVTLIFSPVT